MTGTYGVIAHGQAVSGVVALVDVLIRVVVCTLGYPGSLYFAKRYLNDWNIESRHNRRRGWFGQLDKA